MDKPDKTNNRIFIVGDGESTYRIACNMLNAGQETVLLTADPTEASATIGQLGSRHRHLLTLLADWPYAIPCALAIAITTEQAASKKRIIEQLACRLDDDAIIAVNTESIPLDVLQHAAVARPERVLGLNWCYPADLTLFLEIVTNAASDAASVERLTTLGRDVWGKDPYTVRGGFSVRARMMAAWMREAIYLVENGYASIESIDRACRNDAGFYLPFAGNFRYMDLMGTYAYGMVMKDLNPDLAKGADASCNLDDWLTSYATSEADVRKAAFQRFSKEIRTLILKYAHATLDC